MQKNVRATQIALNKLFTSPCPTEADVNQHGDPDKGQLRHVLQWMGLHDGEKLFGEGNDLFGQHGCNTLTATIFPCHRDSRGDLADLLVAGNTVARQFHRALCEYSDFYSLVILPTNVALIFLRSLAAFISRFDLDVQDCNFKKAPFLNTDLGTNCVFGVVYGWLWENLFCKLVHLAEFLRPSANRSVRQVVFSRGMAVITWSPRNCWPTSTICVLFPRSPL